MKRIIPLMRSFASKIAIVLLLCALGGHVCIFGSNEKGDDALTGTWVMERAVHGGQGLSYEDPQPIPNPTTLTYHKGWYLVESPHRGERYLNYRFNQAKKPHEFDVWYAQNEEEARKETSRKPDAWGIYEFREGQLWRCFVSANKERPKDFDVLNRDGYTLTVHSRVKVASP